MEEYYQQLIEAIGGAERAGPFSMDFLSKEARRRVFPQAKILQEDGTTSDTVYFILEGIVCLRYRHADEQREYNQTAALVNEGHFICTVHSFLTQTPSTQSIELLSPATVLTLSYGALQEARSQIPEAQLLLDKITDDYLEQLKERTLLLGIPFVKDRYRYLAERKPWIAGIPVTYIATYLGTTRETLYRIRSMYR